ncbi:uncharacterized protein [Linepithema humile]|uniref:uncharacterized protein n=1 Tax=Linepithema humile TaxID=83485 RepID=UPI00351F2887
MKATLIILLLLVPLSLGLTGYDCTGNGLNITTLSLIDIGDCNLDSIEPNREETYIQLLQLSDFHRIKIIQCKVEIDRIVYHCGMHSHISIVHNGQRNYVQEIGSIGCSRLHETGTVVIGNAIIDRVPQNRTSRHSITLAGSVATDGRCSGAQYTDGQGSWDSVVVQATVKVELHSFEAPVKRVSNLVMLPSGTTCDAFTGYCIDSEGGESYWPITSIDNCHFDQYDTLYEGYATKLTPRDNQSTPVVYAVTTHGTTFALAKTTEVNLCGYRIYHTEHPKLFIFETQQGKAFRTRSKTPVDNLDIFAYVNSKFVYIEKHVQSQLSTLYQDIMEQKCALEKQILKNALSLASIAPDEMASRIMKNVGYTAVIAGDVIHIIKCEPTECKIRHTEDCYNELPVYHRNISMFLLPRSRILSKAGTRRDCNELLPTMYKLHGIWFRTGQRPTESLPPQTIQPLTNPKWKYVNPSSLATSGIYTNDDLERLRDHIMFPVEKPSTLHNLARGVMGQTVPSGSISILGLLDEKSLDQLAESTGKRIWRGFISFRSASAGVLGIFIVIRVTKLVIDTIIHGYALHSVYGWSLHLLGAIWTSITHLLLHLGQTAPIKEKKTPNQGENVEPSAPSPVPICEQSQESSSGENCNVSEHKYSYKELRQLLDDCPRDIVPQVKVTK